MVRKIRYEDRMKKWRAQLDFLMEKDFDDFTSLELSTIEHIQVRLLHSVHLNTNQASLLHKIFKRKGGKS